MEQISMVINGLKIKTRGKITSTGFHRCEMVGSDNPIPSETKKSRAKKSRKLRTLAIISTLYCKFPSIIPAINAPTATENPKYWNNSEKEKHIASERINSNS